MYSTELGVEIKFLFLWETDVSPPRTIFTESSVVEDIRQNILMVNFEIRREK